MQCARSHMTDKVRDPDFAVSSVNYSINPKFQRLNYQTNTNGAKQYRNSLLYFISTFICQTSYNMSTAWCRYLNCVLEHTCSEGWISVPLVESDYPFQEISFVRIYYYQNSLLNWHNLIFKIHRVQSTILKVIGI